MPKKKDFEATIERLASDFALEIVKAVKQATVQELLDLPGAGGAPTGRRKPGRPPKNKEADGATIKHKKRVVKNYPKCAFPGCEKNRFPRGKGFCGDHFKEFEAGKIQSAEYYKNLSSPS